MRGLLSGILSRNTCKRRMWVRGMGCGCEAGELTSCYFYFFRVDGGNGLDPAAARE